MSGPDFFWTYERCLEFVDIYEEHRVLWDSKHPDFNHKPSRIKAWRAISDHFDVSIDECRKKCRGLKSCMRRELRKMKKCCREGKGPDELYVSGWYAFDRMKFLYQKDLERIQRHAANNKENPRVVSDGSGDETDVNEYSGAQSDESDPTNNNGDRIESAVVASTPSNKIFSAKRKKTQEAPVPKSDVKSFDNDEEELRDFGNFVAKKLRKYNDVTRSCIQNEITSIFLNADRGYYNQNFFTPGALTVLPTEEEVVLPTGTSYRQKSNSSYNNGRP